jgi:hypothetical protein
LVAAYEDVLPAYDKVIKAAENGERDRGRKTTQQSLPPIERFNEVTTGKMRDVEQAAGRGWVKNRGVVGVNSVEPSRALC